MRSCRKSRNPWSALNRGSLCAVCLMHRPSPNGGWTADGQPSVNKWRMDGQRALAPGDRHIAGTRLGTRKYMDMGRLREPASDMALSQAG